ncbi:hypothetical protein KUCAC02_011764, partial [Chaenocephalus aceratus]
EPRNTNTPHAGYGRPAKDQQTDSRQTSRQTSSQTSTQTSTQTSRQTSTQTSRQTAGRPSVRPADRPSGRPADRPAHRPADRPAHRPATTTQSSTQRSTQTSRQRDTRSFVHLLSEKPEQMTASPLGVLPSWWLATARSSFHKTQPDVPEPGRQVGRGPGAPPLPHRVRGWQIFKPAGGHHTIVLVVHHF